MGGYSAIKSGPSLSSWKYLKYKLKTVSIKLNDLPQNTPYHAYITVKNILGQFHPLQYLSTGTGSISALWYLLTGVLYISCASVSFNQYWVYFTPYIYHIIITTRIIERTSIYRYNREFSRRQSSSYKHNLVGQHWYLRPTSIVKEAHLSLQKIQQMLELLDRKIPALTN